MHSFEKGWFYVREFVEYMMEKGKGVIKRENRKEVTS